MTLGVILFTLLMFALLGMIFYFGKKGVAEKYDNNFAVGTIAMLFIIFIGLCFPYGILIQDYVKYEHEKEMNMGSTVERLLQEGTTKDGSINPQN